MNYRTELEQPTFSPQEFVERLAWRTVANSAGGELDPMELQTSFSEAISDLEGILEMQRIKCAQAENALAKEENNLRARLGYVLQRNIQAADSLNALEKKVNLVATKVVHLGDQLESVNLPRERGKEACRLMRHLTDFLQPGSILLSDLFREKENLFQAAEIIHKLHSIAQDLCSSNPIEPGPQGQTQDRFSAAVEKISIKYDEIEGSLIEEFAAAQVAEDRERMRAIAHILVNFKKYHQVVNVFIEQSQTHLPALDPFESVLPLCDANKPIIDFVFPNPATVMGKFVLALLHGRIQETVTNLLYDRQTNQDKFLRNLSSLYSKTRRVVGQLEGFDLGAEAGFLDKIVEQIFRRHLESYVTVEIQCLQRKFKRILGGYYQSLGHQKKQQQGSFQSVRRDLQLALGAHTPLTVNFAQIETYGGETFLSEEVAINLLQETRMAYARCSLLLSSKKKQELATGVSQIFDQITSHLLREHVEYALDLGIGSIPLPEVGSFPEIHFFGIVKSANAIVHLFEKELGETVLGAVKGTHRLLECVEKKRVVLESIETKLDIGLERSLETIVGWIRLVLQTEYNRKEFFKAEVADDDQQQLYQVSPACEKICNFVRSQVNKIRDCMDGKNVQLVLTELGTRFHRVIYEHLLQFTYSSVGAFSLICDVGEYRKCAKDFKMEVVIKIFDTLHALCSLLLVLPKDLPISFNREELTCLDPAIRMNFVQLRTDFKTAKNYLGTHSQSGRT